MIYNTGKWDLKGNKYSFFQKKYSLFDDKILLLSNESSALENKLFLSFKNNLLFRTQAKNVMS